jgi:hypothetical protein
MTVNKTNGRAFYFVLYDTRLSDPICLLATFKGPHAISMLQVMSPMNLILKLPCCLCIYISRNQISISVASVQQLFFFAHIHISVSSKIHTRRIRNTTK